MDEEKKKKTISIELGKVIHNVHGKAFTTTDADEYGNPVLLRMRADGVGEYRKTKTTMKQVIITALTGLTEAESKGKTVGGMRKLKMDMFARKIAASEEEFWEFTPSQVSLICKRVDAIYKQKSIVSIVWQEFNYNIPDNFEFDE